VLLTLTPPILALLDVLQYRQGVFMGVLDASLHPAQPADAGDFAGMLDAPGVRERCLTALRSGEGRVERGPIPLGIYPLRPEQEVIGLLLVSPRRARTDAAIDKDVVRRVEAAGQVGRGILELELLRAKQLAQAADRNRRLKGILRFIGQVSTRGGERDMMQAVVQAATVWFELDCRIYNRQPGGDFALFAALPGIAPNELQQRLDGRRFQDMPRVRRLASSSDLDLVGWSGRRDEVLILSIGAGPDWLMILTGAPDAEAESTFEAIAHVLEGELRHAADRRTEHWRERLRARTAEAEGTPDAALTQMLAELTGLTGADEAIATLHRGGAQRTFKVGTGPPSGSGAVKHTTTRPIGFQAHVEITLAGNDPFRFEALSNVDAWVAAVQPWLSGTLAAQEGSALIADPGDELAFEQRVHDEVERAKRFDLGLSLLIIDAAGLTTASGSHASRVADAVRGELRASDLFGRVRGGKLAVVLVHAGPEGAQSVAKRVRRAVAALLDGTHRAAIRLGHAVFSSECTSADALIRQALRGLEEPNSSGA
jgi:GGDEF domain-containing protein